MDFHKTQKTLAACQSLFVPKPKPMRDVISYG